MAISRNYQYQESTRPKLSRNIYDHIYDNKSESNSVFATTGGGYSISQVGGALVDISDFSGATASSNGERGLVPQPLAGQQDYFLQATGAWVDIPAYRWFEEFPSNSTTKTGLSINGDLNVGDTLSVQTLKVEGAAHFWSLLVDEARANGGSIYVSPALFEVDYVDSTGTSYPVSGNEMQTILNQRSDIATALSENGITHIHTQRAYMRCDDNSRRTRNECVIGDMMRCHTFNLDGIYAGQTYQNVSNKEYWTFVVNVSDGTVDYTTADGSTVKCFWIDLADYAISSGGRQYSLETEFWYEGGITIDPNQNTDIDLTDLKRQAGRTYNGITTVDTEYGDVTTELINQICSIYGIEPTLVNMTGASPNRSSSSSSDEITSFDLVQLQSGLNQITGGVPDTYNDDMDAANLSGLILDNSLATSIPTENDLDAADGLAYDILGLDQSGTTYYTEEEGEERTSSGMRRAPAYSPSSSSSGSTQESWLFGYGTFDLAVDDQLASFGHLFDEDRMDAIIISAITSPDMTLTAPSIAQYVGINRFGEQLVQFRTTALAANGNEFQGSFLVNNNGTLMDVNEKIDLFMTDLTSGLETVGIHLDGENSRIRLVGSVEIRQHDANDYDTLTVWDSSSNKKVEISPKTVPALSSIQTNIVMEQNNVLPTAAYNSTWYSITKEYKRPLGFNNNYWMYTLTGSSGTFVSEIGIGDLSSGDQVTIGGGGWILSCPLLVSGSNGTTNVTDRTGQEITSFVMKLKRNGTYITGANVDIKNSSSTSNYMPSSTALASDSIAIVVPVNLMSTFTVGSGNYSAGSYSIEFTLVFKYCGIYKEVCKRSQEIANPYMITNSTLTGNVNTTIQKSSATADAFMQIGSNGLAFSMGANKYMYASDSAMKLNWKSSSWSGTPSSGVGIEFSNDYGLQILKNVKTYSSQSNTIDSYVDVGIINCSSRTSVTITLPSAANYGNGRIIELLFTNTSSLTNGYNSITISSSSSVNTKNHTINVTYGQDSYVYTGTYWDGTFKFISANSSWYEL